MRTCENCGERYDKRDGAFGLCDPCRSAAAESDCDEECCHHQETDSDN